MNQCVPQNKGTLFFLLVFLLALQFYFGFCAASIHHNAFPEDTDKNGGQSSFETPSIKVQYRFKFWFIDITKNDTIKAGESTTLGYYTYFAALCPNQDVSGKICQNKCAYGATCDNAKSMCSAGTNCDTTNEIDCSAESQDKSTAQCDKSLTSSMLYSCDPSRAGTAVGICAYVSKKPNILAALKLANINNDLDQARTDANNQLRCTGSPFSDYDLIDCFPVPYAPEPPPFGKGPFQTLSTVGVYRICSQDELDVNGQPIHPLSSYTNPKLEHGCVLPNPNTPNKYGTFSNTCVRITYDNPTQPNDSDPQFSDPAFYNKDGGYYERLYQFSLTSAPGDTTPYPSGPYYRRNSVLYNDLNAPQPSVSESGYYYNNAPYIDLCLTVSADGNTTPDSGILLDQPDSKSQAISRHFTVYLKKITPPKDEPSDVSFPNYADEKFFGTEVCVRECPSGNCDTESNFIERGCITRPALDKPTVMFCDNDDPTSPDYKPCLQAKIAMAPDKAHPNDEHTFQSNEPNSKNLSVNPFQLDTVLTNQCYLNIFSNFDIPTNANGCYSSPDLLSKCTTVLTPLSKCTNPIQCTCFSNGVITKGATKFCLKNYTMVQSRLSPIWCGSTSTSFTPIECKTYNKICAKYYIRSDQDSPDPFKVASDYIAYRTDPSPASPGLLPDSSFCSDPTSDAGAIGNPTGEGTMYRVKNPIEEDLCIDVYPIQFKSQKNLSEIQINQLIPAIKSTCFKSSDRKTYDYFAACMSMYNLCATESLFSLTVAKALTASANASVYTSQLAKLLNFTCYDITSLYADVKKPPPPSSSTPAGSSTIPYNPGAEAEAGIRNIPILGR